MTAARRTIVTPTAVTPTSKNIATQIGGVSSARDRVQLYFVDGEIWQYNGYQPSVYEAVITAYDYDLNMLRQGVLDKGSNRTYANGGLVEVSGRYFVSFATLSATREQGLVEIDGNLDIVGSNYIFWDDGGASNNLVYLSSASNGTHIYVLGRNDADSALTFSKFDANLTLVDSDKFSTSVVPFGCCVDASGNAYFITALASGIHIYTYNSSFTLGNRYYCANIGLIKSTRMCDPVWYNGNIYVAIIGRNAGGVEDFVLFKIADDFSSYDRVNANAISNQNNGERTGQVSVRPNGNIVVAVTYRDSGILRPVLFEFDSSLNNVSQFWASNAVTVDTGCAAMDNNSAYWAFHRDGDIDVLRVDDMSYPNPTTPACATITIQNTSNSFTVYSGLSITSDTPSSIAPSVNETIGTLTDGADVFTQNYNCEFNPS